MRIAHLITTLSFGGAQRQLLLLCEGLQQHNHSVLVGSLKGNGELASEFQNHVHEVRQFHMAGALDVRAFFAIRKWLKETHPDLVHTHLFKADVLGGLAAISLGIPLISTKHNEDQYLRNSFIAFIARTIASRSFAVIAISNAVRSFLTSVANMKEDHVEVIPYGLYSNADFASHSGSDTVRFGVVGRLVPQKGHQYLFQAFANARSKARNIQLLVFGSGPLERNLRSIADSLHVNSSVMFKGFVPNVNSIYENIDVLVLPSLWEGAGLVLLEAMQRGIPVIATATGGITEFVNEKCAVIVPPKDIEALANALLEMASNPELRSRLGEVAIQRARLFDFGETLTSHLKLYERAVR